MLYNLIKFIILCVLAYYSGFYLSKIIDYLFALVILKTSLQQF